MVTGKWIWRAAAAAFAVYQGTSGAWTTGILEEAPAAGPGDSSKIQFKWLFIIKDDPVQQPQHERRVLMTIHSDHSLSLVLSKMCLIIQLSAFNFDELKTNLLQRPK
jgi:hypothetical protein